ncbi:hypothetical protein E2C01_072309 [Portunus trituberculatus]|uniref:Uncharacterized protein n=1 Tax=Portunus trituberculatus TaxID=210409 RepID=A0A5B7I2A2_PORTR|nr:hypothetical protein [Portunus trituberculatus]
MEGRGCGAVGNARLEMVLCWCRAGVAVSRYEQNQEGYLSATRKGLLSGRGEGWGRLVGCQGAKIWASAGKHDFPPFTKSFLLDTAVMARVIKHDPVSPLLLEVSV